MIKDKRTIQGILNEMASLGFHSILVDGNGWTTCKRKNKNGDTVLHHPEFQLDLPIGEHHLFEALLPKSTNFYDINGHEIWVRDAVLFMDDNGITRSLGTVIFNENGAYVKKNDDCKFMLKTETISDYSVEKVNLEKVDLTLDDAIKHATEVAEQKEICKECSIQHKQLATWLIELKKRREDAWEYGKC